MKLIQITLNYTPTEAENHLYRMDIKGNSGIWKSVYYGKFYTFPDQTDVVIDVTDILYDYRMTGTDTIAPVTDIAAGGFVMPDYEHGTADDLFKSEVRLVSIDTTPAFNDTYKTFYFITDDFVGHSSIGLPDRGLYIPIADNQPIPHLPSNPPDGFTFTQIVYTVTESAVKAVGDSEIQFTVDDVPANTPYRVPFELGHSRYRINDTTVAITDKCDKPYYLLWLTNNGGMQCQGFLNRSEFSVNYNTRKRVDLFNNEWSIGGTANGNWKLKSANLTDNEYSAYGELFNSPYIVLIDTQNSKLHYVNVVMSDYVEKKRVTNDRKPVYFEIEVSDIQHIRV